MPAARVLGASIPLFLLLAAVVGAWWVVREERRNPSSYPERAARRSDLEGWDALSTQEQEAADTAALDLAEQAELDAEDDAREAAQFAVYRMGQVNALYRP